MNIHKLYALAFGLFFLFYSLPAQNCYVPLDDVSGFDTSPYQQELADSACALIGALPPGYQNQFKVYDFGFYLHQEHYQGGFPQVFLDKVAEVEQLSPYYLLFGRQSDQTGINTKFWLKLKLPTGNEFSCFESDFYDKIEFKVLQKVNAIYVASGNSPYAYSSAEIEGIKELKEWIIEIINCCDPELKDPNNSCSLCSWSTQEVIDFLVLNNFDQDSISVSASLPTIDSLCICSTNFNLSSSTGSGNNYEVEKHVSIEEFSLNGTNINIASLYIELEELATLYGNSGFTFYGAITDNGILCPSNETVTLKKPVNSTSFEDVENKFNAIQVGVWIHIQYDNSLAILNTRTKGIGGNIIQNCNSYPQYCDELDYVVERLESLPNSFYNEIVQQYCAQNSLDLEIRIADTGGDDSGGETSSLKDVIRHKLVVIKLNENKFSENDFCDSESLGYLYIAKTLLHESVHAILKRLSTKADGKTSDEKKRNLNSYSYGYTYAFYRNNGQPEHLASFYTEHWILLKFFFRKITKTLHSYNDEYGEEKNYFWMTYNFSWTPTLPLDDLKNITGHDSFDSVPEIEAQMESDHEVLKNNSSLPCAD